MHVITYIRVLKRSHSEVNLAFAGQLIHSAIRIKWALIWTIPNIPIRAEHAFLLDFSNLI
jgi:hypothetical protein